MSVLINGQNADADIRTTLGLLGDNNSLAYRVMEIEKHIHGVPIALGNDGAGSCTVDGVTVWQVAAGNGAWGQEEQIHDGTVIESGSSTKKFDFHVIFVTAVGTANRLALIEFSETVQAAAVNLDGATNATNKLDLTGHSLSDGNKIMLSTSASDLPNGLLNYIVYYVVGAGVNDFQVSLTSGGAAVTFSDDGTGTHSYHTLTQTKKSGTYVSAANVNNDATPIVMPCARMTCDKRVTMRAKAVGGTNTISFVAEAHSYVA